MAIRKDKVSKLLPVYTRGKPTLYKSGASARNFVRQSVSCFEIASRQLYPFSDGSVALAHAINSDIDRMFELAIIDRPQRTILIGTTKIDFKTQQKLQTISKRVETVFERNDGRIMRAHLCSVKANSDLA